MVIVPMCIIVNSISINNIIMYMYMRDTKFLWGLNWWLHKSINQ